MRVVVTVPWGERLGGAEAILQTLLDGSRDMGHEVELVFFTAGPWPSRLAESGFVVSIIKAGRMRELHKWAPTVIRLARLLGDRKPDVILNWSAKTQLYGSPAAVLAGMKDRLIWWQQVIPDGGWLDRCATALPATAIGCYGDAATEAQARLRPSRPTFVVQPGVSAQHPDSSKVHLDIPSDESVIGIVGRLQPWKGQDRLLRAHAALRARGQSVHTLIVGGDAYGLSPEYAESISALIGELQLNGEVTMTGHVDDARPYIREMDVLVNASDPEPFGIVLLEAMAVGVPVVAVDSGGPAEFIENGRTGRLARSGEPSDLVEALEPLLESSELRRTIGEAGREQYEREFTDVAMRKRFFDCLGTVIRDKNKLESLGR